MPFSSFPLIPLSAFQLLWLLLRSQVFWDLSSSLVHKPAYTRICEYRDHSRTLKIGSSCHQRIRFENRSCFRNTPLPVRRMGSASPMSHWTPATSPSQSPWSHSSLICTFYWLCLLFPCLYKRCSVHSQQKGLDGEPLPQVCSHSKGRFQWSRTLPLLPLRLFLGPLIRLSHSQVSFLIHHLALIWLLLSSPLLVLFPSSAAVGLWSPTLVHDPKYRV